MKEVLIRAGINEINTHGVTSFSVRRVAEACNVSCAAPYKHFKDKREFVAAIIEYVNGQWKIRQQEILEQCGGDLRSQIVEVSVGYIRFLMEKPYYRSILTLKDEQFDNIYHKTRGQISSRSQQMEQAYFASVNMDEPTRRRKLLAVRSLVFGAVFLFDKGEWEFNEENLGYVRYSIDREFDLP